MRVFRFLLLAVCVISAAGCSDGIDLSVFAQTRQTGRFERTLPVSGPVDLSVRTGSGDIDIRTGNVNQVQVTGRITASSRLTTDEAAQRIKQIESMPPIEQQGNVVRIGDTRDDPRYRDISISYELVVPNETRLNSQTGSGDQRIGSINGQVRVQTGSGDIQVERAGGGLDAQTGSGDVSVSAVGGAVRVQTGSGDVDLVQLTKADVEARTGSGDVDLRLPSDAAFELSARTGSGSINTTQPLEVRGERRRNRLEGTVRGGGNRVDITTGSGSISIR